MTDDHPHRSGRPLLSPIPTGLSPVGSLRAPIRAALFDVYGTLFISGSGDIGTTAEATEADSRLEELMGRYGVAGTAESLRRNLKRAVAADHAESRKAGIAFPEVEIARVWQRVFGWTDRDRAAAFALDFEKVVNPVEPMPGLAALLATLRRAKMPMGIVSNAQFYTPGLFEAFLGRDLRALGFVDDLVVFSYRLREAKPSKRLFERCIAGLGRRKIRPREALYIGNDMGNDILPAASVGLQTVLFAGDARSLRLRRDRSDCRNLEPDAVVTHLDQLPTLMGLPDG